MPKVKPLFIDPGWSTKEINNNIKLNKFHNKPKHTSDYHLQEFRRLREKVKHDCKITYENSITSVENKVTNNNVFSISLPTEFII